jgi:NADP-dependent aldehyde dehydrogenase
MAFHGKNFIGSALSAEGSKTIHGWNPKAGVQLEDTFVQATAEEIDRAARAAERAFQILRELEPEKIAAFLEAVAREIEALGDVLIQQGSTESGLASDRLTGERGRTTGQLRLFATLVRDGSYLDARIDTAIPDRKPIPKPDLRRMLVPLGPVAVFGASNFPLAFSVAGGDTASAFAARNPVVVKAHPAHPGTSELVAGAIAKAVVDCGFPDGTFSMVHATDPEVSLSLVKHPSIRAVGFTGSERAGRAIFNAAAERPVPIPAYCEMGSNNPVFILPGALASSPETIVQGLYNSMTLAVGQFCVAPGVVLGQQSPGFAEFAAKLGGLVEKGSAGSMLHPSILKGYLQNVEKRQKSAGVQTLQSTQPHSDERTEATPVLFETTADVWLGNDELADEIFGPSAVVVRSQSKEELLKVAREWRGSLTATIFGTPEDLVEYRELVAILEDKAGRIVFNGFPTGVEVTHAMHHGGPYPATTDSKFTSVGTQAILRFLRPVCLQNFPASSLPPELRNENPRKIWRLVNGKLTEDPI